MDGAFARVCESRGMVDLAAKRLLLKYRADADPEPVRDVQKFVACCKTICTGDTVWSLKGGRYKIRIEASVGVVEIEI